MEFYRPDGLLEMRTAVENNYNIVCVTDFICIYLYLSVFICVHLCSLQQAEESVYICGSKS